MLLELLRGYKKKKLAKKEKITKFVKFIGVDQDQGIKINKRKPNITLNLALDFNVDDRPY